MVMRDPRAMESAQQIRMPRAVGQTSSVLLALIVALSIVGYPLVGGIGSIIGVQSVTASIPFRVLVDLLCFAGLIGVLIRRHTIRLDPLLVVFLLWYLLRLIWDTQNPIFDRVWYDLSFYVGVALIPTIAVGIMAPHWRDRNVAKAIFLIGSAGMALALGMYFTGFYAIAGSTKETGRLTLEAVSPIVFGHLGASVLLVSATLWPKSVPTERPFILIGGLAAAWLMWIANSRSPFLSVAIASVAFLVATKRWVHLAAAGSAAALIFTGSAIQQALVGSRLISLTDQSSLIRLAIQRNALEDFIAHPLTGYGYLDSVSVFYPHNIWLESAMAMGIGGAALLLLLTLLTSIRSVAAFRSGNIALGLLYWQFFVLAALSGSLYYSGPLYITMIVLHHKYPVAISFRGSEAARRKVHL